MPVRAESVAVRSRSRRDAMRATGVVIATVALGALAAGATAAIPAHAATTFNVKTFGAKGNGTTLDDDAIDKAINAASAAPGGVVLFPSGTYLSRTIH